jgi:lysophospholipase L1-like esterase
MADENSVSPGLATLGAGGWTVTEPSAGGRFGSVGVLTPQQTLATQALVSAPWDIRPRSTPVRSAFVGDSRAVIGSTRNTGVSPQQDTQRVVSSAWNSGAKSFNMSLDRFALPVFYPLCYPVACCGVAGDQTPALLARDTVAAAVNRFAITDAIDTAPDVAVLTIGINNFVGVTSGTYAAQAATTYGNVCTAIQRLLTGIPFVIDEGDYGYADGTAGAATDAASTRAALVACNSMRKAYAAQFPGRVYFVDWTGILCDASGNWLPGMSADGLHLSVAGQLVRSQTLAAILAQRFGGSFGPRYPGANIITNALMVNASAGTATGFTLAATVASVANKKIEVIDGRNWQTGEWTMAGAGGVCTINMPFDPTTMGITSGSLWGFEFDFLIQGLNGYQPTIKPAGSYGQVRIDNSVGSGQVYVNSLSSAQAWQVPSGGVMGRCVIPPIQIDDVSANFLTSSRFQMVINCDDAAGTMMKMGVSEPRIVKLGQAVVTI